MSINEQIQQEINALPPAQQQQVLTFVQGLRNGLADQEAAALAEAGAKLAVEVWEPEDFSDWERQGEVDGGKQS